MTLKNTLKTLLGATIIAMTGACSNITNLTPEKVPENPSGIYTLSMSASVGDGNVVKGSIAPFLVVDGGMIPMKEASKKDGVSVYECEYTLPKGRESATYYYVVKYLTSNASTGAQYPKQFQSDVVYTLKPVSQYVANMAFERAPIGSVVPVLGRGFNSQDKVKFGPVYADIRNITRNSINFIVPPLPANKTYDVEIETSAGKSWIGQFKIDPSEISISPEKLNMQSGDVVNVVFYIGFRAPEGGYKIDVKTNVPSSVVMPEVVVKEGEDRVIVPIKAASIGEGFLFANATGFTETIIPVKVSASASGADYVKSAIKNADK